jgi:DNA (cytosine-5)-methyltransferase 1
MINFIQNQSSTLKNLRFIDLFAGIGGFHLALTSFGAKCVFASEWDISAKNLYYKNFGLEPAGDITKIPENSIPKHDVLCGGFPCQAFSVSGKQRGFQDARGTLFFEIARIIDYHNPNVIFLENVKNLVNHDKGKTLKEILRILNELNYNVYYKVLNTSNFGLPQNRERVYIVGFKNNLKSNNFQFPYPENEIVCLKDFLEKDNTNAKVITRNDIYFKPNVNSKNNLFSLIEKYNRPIQIGKVNKGGQGERIYHINGHAITLSAYGGGVGGKTGLYLVNDLVRKLSPRECARIQGFPDSFILDKSISQAYKQFGNSVSVNVLQHIIIEISKVLKSNEIL